jgi:MYXO-CTERM domain-containing protein
VQRSELPSSGLGIIHGGGYTYNAGSQSYSTIPVAAPIINEFQVLNTRGTIGMARMSDLNSARSQWFFNTSDNSALLGAGNPYATFGWVVGAGMNIVDRIGGLTPDGYIQRDFRPASFFDNQAFYRFPTAQSYTDADYANLVKPTADQMPLLESISIVRTHPSFQNPVLSMDVNNDGLANQLDLLLLTNHLINLGPHPADASYITDRYYYFDTNGDGQVNDLDLVPEPSSVTLAGLGLAALALAGVQRRRRRGQH